MRQLVIAVDCDDVLVPSTQKIVALYNQQYGTNVQLDGAHVSKNPDWQASREDIAERIYDIQLMNEYVEMLPFDDAIRCCRELMRNHELHLVTARPGRIMHTTLAMLEKYFPGVFTEIEHVGLDGSKGEVCQRLKADVLIDDNYKHLVSARECGVDSLVWFGDYPWQTQVDASGGAMRCRSWYEVQDEIKRITND